MSNGSHSQRREIPPVPEAEARHMVLFGTLYFPTETFLVNGPFIFDTGGITMANDSFAAHGDAPAAPSRAPFAVTPHDTNELTTIPKALYIGTGGTLVLRGVEGSADVTFKNIGNGQVIDVRALCAGNGHHRRRHRRAGLMPRGLGFGPGRNARRHRLRGYAATIGASLPPSWAMARASGGTRFDGAGTLQTAANNIERITYTPSTLALRGLLLEPPPTASATTPCRGRPQALPEPCRPTGAWAAAPD